ncbi:LPS-assembly protein [Geoalkalibacter ferrihydriticus]|nr:LPS assembly protein LptD [Geoalkalibacter ferrihydriticus]SDL34157.1 LPS-assembly protein [Geoalkalibacter ferrihydriticus]
MMGRGVRCFPPAGLLFLLLLLVPVSSGADDLGPVSRQGAQPVEIEADYLSSDRQTGLFLARGNVRIRQGDLTLLADEVQWHPQSGEARAPGTVSVIDAEGTLRGEDLVLNLETGQGRMAQGRFFLAEQNLYVTGEGIERLSAQQYRLARGTFTTCDGERPDWQFSARDLEVNLGRIAKGRHARFYLKDLPVLYVPFFFYPAKTERESGFLMPRYGYSDRRGWEVSLAYYQVIAPNQDATLHLDYLTELGIGKGLEYRYIFADHEGEAMLYHISGINDQGDAYAVDWRNVGELPGALRLGADVEYVSDRDYLQTFGEAAGEYNRDKTESKIFVSRSWDKYTLGGQLKYLKNLDQPTGTTLQRLPEVRFSAIPRRLAESPLFFGFDGSYDHFWRRAGDKGQRLSLRPTLAAPFQVGVLEVTPELAFRQRFYSASGAEDDFSQKGMVEFSTRLSSTFARVFSLQGRRISRIQHLIGPDATHSYTPRGDESRLPQFDAEDRIGGLHRVSYGLTNRLTARIEPPDGPAHYHEFLYFRLSQQYDIRESPADPLNPRDNLRPFSDLRAELLLRPTRWGYLDIDSRYDFQTAESKGMGFATLSVDAGVDDERGNGAALGYHYLREDLDYLEARLRTAILHPVHADLLYRHDLRSATTLETVLDLEYRSQCWSLFLTLSDRPDETRYLISFALTGVGRVGKFGGSLARAD